MVPDVEEVRGEPQTVALAEFEVLHQGEIPVLLEWSTIDIAAKIAPCGEASVGIERAARGICERGGREVGWIQIAVVHAIVNAATAQSIADGCTGKLRTGGAALQTAADVGGTGRAVQDR